MLFLRQSFVTTSVVQAGYSVPPRLYIHFTHNSIAPPAAPLSLLAKAASTGSVLPVVATVVHTHVLGRRLFCSELCRCWIASSIRRSSMDL